MPGKDRTSHGKVISESFFSKWPIFIEGSHKYFLTPGKYTLAKLNNEILAGGFERKCDIFGKVGHSIENIFPQHVEDYMEAINRKLCSINRVNFPYYLEQSNASFDDIAIHGLLRQRLSKGTVDRNIRYMRFMEQHCVPVNFRSPSLENWLQHIDYREQIEFDNCINGQGIGAIRHEWAAMKMVLRAYNIPIWNYKPPSVPERPNEFPIPTQVYTITHNRWSNDPYVNALIQYYLTFNFVIGWRPPSEPAYCKVSQVDFKRGFLKIVEPKKRLRERKIKPDEVLDNPRTKSLSNWIDKWRSKVENQYSKDFLFIDANGKPFYNEKCTEPGARLRMFVNRILNPKIYDIYPEWYPYTSRKFCGVARLLRSYHNSGKSKSFDIYTVNTWLGHKKLSQTLTYVKDAELYVEDKFDWIYRALKKAYGLGESTALNQEPLKNSSLDRFFSEKIRRRLPDSNILTGENLVKKVRKIRLTVFWVIDSLTKPFFSFFCPFRAKFI